MQFAYLLSSNSTPRSFKIQCGEASSISGVPYRASDGDDAGPILGETTSCADFVGVAQDNQSSVVTAQQSDASDPERAITLIINPDAVYKTKLSGGSSSDTALTQHTVTTASTTGLVVTTGDDFSSTSFDEGSIWGYSGNNAGVHRKITSVSQSAATVTVAFPADTAAGDIFLAAPFFPLENQFVQLTSTFEQIDCTVAVDTTNNNFRIVEMEANDITNSGTVNSFAYLSPFDSLLASGGSI